MSTRSAQASGAAARGNADAARAAKVRRSAWLLAGLAAFFYLGYLAWNFLRAPLGG